MPSTMKVEDSIGESPAKGVDKLDLHNNRFVPGPDCTSWHGHSVIFTAKLLLTMTSSGMPKPRDTSVASGEISIKMAS